MSPRLVLICLALLVVLYAPLPTTAAPHEVYEVALAKGEVDTELEPTSDSPAPPAGKPQQRTLFLLLPLFFPDQFYFA